MFYMLCVSGELEKRWELWFDGFSIYREVSEEGEALTCLIGRINDRAELYGTISKLRDVGLDLVSVKKLSGMEKVNGPEEKEKQQEKNYD